MHDGLLAKIKNLLPPGNYLFYKSFLKDQYFFVRLNSTFSPLSNISIGILQGGISSPLLFNIYIEDQHSTNNIFQADYAD